MKSLSPQLVREAIAVLKKGGVVVFPTETSYGIAADATNTRAIKKVFAIKGRSSEFPPPLIVSSATAALQTVVLSSLLLGFAKRYWPGPLTVKATPQKGVKLSSWVKRPDGSVVIRVSSHVVSKALAKGLGRPIIATSANRHGMRSCYSVPAFRRQLKGQKFQPDMFLDIGAIPVRKASTIIGEEEGKIVIHRQGSIRIPKMYVT